eukprot:TRINITY_DN6156_c0_g2_i1.p1 TRINITY_DN6156_c0_g2~~TRINITY_DN6156_c0_g2_i1.p1  ORF type:complete len:716 (+),score=81.71 TRINITY_DN6156_c0_g2_i1:61-2208(+)
MVFSKKDDFGDDGKNRCSNHENLAPNDVVDDTSFDRSDIGSSAHLDTVRESRGSSGGQGGFAERLRDILGEEGEGDLLIRTSDGENGVLQWIQALDLQVIGACRADERLKPLLKLNVSSGVAEDRLLAHLSQHFEVSEVGMLARCLCIPLVSIRVGKVIKQGTLLCPTATRGHLNLTLLPSSDLRISFSGDDGSTEKLAVLGGDSGSTEVIIEEIIADSSGRSFLLRLPGGRVSYFWCSVKSKLLGAELLSKMKDLLRRKPSLAELTGICESRLDCFATHLRAYLLGSTPARANPTISSISFFSTESNFPESDASTHLSSTCSKPSRSRSTTGQPSKAHSLYQGSLSPRLNTFKDGPQKNSFSTRSGTREKMRRRGDGSHSGAAENLSTASTCTSQTENEKIPEKDGKCNFLPLPFPGTLCSTSINPLQFHHPLTQIPESKSSLFSHYCWCPPCISTLPSHVPSVSTESLSLPPLSSLLSTRSSVPPEPLDLTSIPSLEFPAFLADPSLVRISLPVSSFVTIPSSHQIPTFTPFMSDPIVHIPVIDVCSSGQGYLVSAGPSISTTIIPPLLPNLVNPLIPEAESAVEKSARDTLRLLIGSTQTGPPLMEMFPAVLTSIDEDLSCVHGRLVAGSRGLYSGTSDIGMVGNGIPSMGLLSLPVRTIAGGAKSNRPRSHQSDKSEDRSEGHRVLEGFHGRDNDGSSSDKAREGGSNQTD